MITLLSHKKMLIIFSAVAEKFVFCPHFFFFLKKKRKKVGKAWILSCQTQLSRMIQSLRVLVFPHLGLEKQTKKKKKKTHHKRKKIILTYRWQYWYYSSQAQKDGVKKGA